MVSIQVDRLDGLSSSTAVKGPCRVATTENITLSDLQTIDGVALADGDRVLVRAQTDAKDNGIYVASTGNWRRSKDFSSNRDVRKGTMVVVTDGDTHESSSWIVTTENPVVFDTSNITFIETIFIYGNEEVKTANYTITVDDNRQTIVANSASAIAFTLPEASDAEASIAGQLWEVRVFNIGAGTLTVDGAGAETINGQASIAISQNLGATLWTDGTSWRASGLILDGTLTEPKYATGSVSTRALAADAVTTDKIAAEAVTLTEIDAAAKSDFRLVDPNGPRLPWKYHGATTMQVTGVHSLAMGGFRIDGRCTVDRAPVFAAPAFTSEGRHILSLGDGSSTAGDLFAEAWHVKSNWYALLAAANDGDPAFDFGFMPWFRVGSVAGNVITLNQGGENQRSVSGKTYQIATDELVGCQVWVRTETLDGRANAFSNRMATVTANTGTTITLDDVGGMAAYDYFLASPPGYDHFVYLCTGYMDTAELRNIADTGSIVGSRGSANTQANISGNVATSVAVPVDGHISPAATAVVFSHTDSHSTSSGGDCVVRYGMDDGNHDTHEFYYHKDGSASQAFTFQFPPVPFSFFPKLYFYSGGSLNGASNTRTMNMRGWLEP